MQRGERLLLDRLHGHGMDIGIAQGFEQTGSVCTVGLVAHHVGANVSRREEDHAMSQVLDLTAPVVCRCTRFHHHGCGWPSREEGKELAPRQAMALA